MIKPDTLWNLFKHGDAITIGRVCIALADRVEELDSPLNPYETMFFNMIREAEEWMDEAVEAVKKRKHDWYEKKKQKINLTDLTSKKSNASIESIDYPPSVRPSVHPSNNIENKECVSPARTREAPSWNKVKKHITSPTTPIQIPESFARQWYDECVTVGWVDTKGQDIGKSWKNKLLFRWRDEEKAQRDRNGGKTDKEMEEAKQAYERWNKRVLSEENDD